MEAEIILSLPKLQETDVHFPVLHFESENPAYLL